MTEEKWLACEKPMEMLKFVRSESSDRKLRLIACGAVRRIWHLLFDPRSRDAVEVAEKLADGLITKDEWWDAVRFAERVLIDLDGDEATNVLVEEAERAVRHAATAAKFTLLEVASNAVNSTGEASVAIGAFAGRNASDPNAHKLWMEAVRTAGVGEINLIRCIIGNPFHPITLSPSWLTSTVVSLANQMYDARDFSAMPILADALMDASFDNEEILTHCRSAGPHTRGCWVLDLLTGRE
jgi:hypothetical protein